MEQSRACYPDEEGYVQRDGVRVFYEVYGSGEPTMFLLPTWSIIHSRQWKMQIPYLARQFRVMTFDGRGNGRSDGPRDAEAYASRENVADAIAVIDGPQTERAVSGRGLPVRRALGRLARREAPRTDAWPRSSVRRSSWRRRRPSSRATPFKSGATPTKGGRSTTCTTGGATTAGFVEFFL